MSARCSWCWPGCRSSATSSLIGGDPWACWRDVQVRAFLRWIGYAVGVIILYRMTTTEGTLPDVLRGTVFNVITLFTGTGYGSEDVPPGVISR